MSELAEELRGLQAVCERFGVDDDDALNRAADKLEKLQVQLAAVRGARIQVIGGEYVYLVSDIKAAIEENSHAD